MGVLYFLLYSVTGDSDFKLIYRHYATLYFVFCVDQSESELGVLDLIQVRSIYTHEHVSAGSSSSDMSSHKCFETGTVFYIGIVPDYFLPKKAVYLCEATTLVGMDNIHVPIIWQATIVVLELGLDWIGLNYDDNIVSVTYHSKVEKGAAL